MKYVSTILMLLVTTSTFSAEAQPPMCREGAHVQYTDPAIDTFQNAANGAKVVLDSVDWNSVKQESVKDLKKTWAPQRTHWYIQTEPDTMREGPWSNDL